MQEFRRLAENGNQDTFKRMTKAERFKVGRQWDNDVLKYNESHRKHSLTINRILPVVLHLDGQEIQNPRDFKVHNVKGGTRKIAEILTALAKHTTESNHFNRQKSLMFDNGLTTGRGYVVLDISFVNDPNNGDFTLATKDPFMVLPDPNRKTYDLNGDIEGRNGAKFVIVDEWEDKEKLEAQYPAKKKELGEADFTPKSTGRFSSLLKFMFKNFIQGGRKDDYRDDTKLENTESDRWKYNYKVSTCWWKEWKKGVYVQKTDDLLSYITLTDPKAISEAQTRAEEIGDIRVVDKDREGKPLVVPVLNKTIMVGDVLLKHIKDPFKGISLYPVFLYNPYYQNGYEFGIVENLIGPQEHVNWSWSQELNILKLLANAGWYIKQATDKAKNWLKTHGTEDGIVIEKKDYGDFVEKIKPNDFPAGMDIVTEKGSRHIAEISQTRLEIPESRAKESGRAIALKQQASFTGSAMIFSNYDYTIQIMGRMLVELIRNVGVYSEQEIMAIIDEEDLIDDRYLDIAREMVLSQLEQRGVKRMQQPQEPNPVRFQNAEPQDQAKMYEQFKQQTELYRNYADQIESMAQPIAKALILDEIRKYQHGRYDTEVELSPSAPTNRILKSIETFELNKQLVESNHQPIGRKLLIESTDVPNKEEMMNEEVKVPA